MEGFYKQQPDGSWNYGTVIHNKDYTLTEANKDEAQDGWVWATEQPMTDFEKWEARVDAVKDLKDQAAESPLALRPYITTWYIGAEPLLAAFISAGSNVFLDEVTNSELPWWDMRQDENSPSPREITIEVIEPLIVS